MVSQTFKRDGRRPHYMTTREDLIRDLEGSQELAPLRAALIQPATAEVACDFDSVASYLSSPST